jgi:hypothetical protein
VDIAFDCRSKLIPRAGQIMHGLEIHPELRAIPEKTAKPKRGIRGDRTLTLDDRTDAVGRYVQCSSQSVYGQTERLEKFFPKDLTRMGSNTMGQNGSNMPDW